MISKLLAIVFVFMNNQENMAAIEDLARTKKMDGLAQLVTLLSIFSLVLFILLTINLVKNFKLNAEIKRLKNH